MSDIAAAHPRDFATAVWSGTQMLVFGGVGCYPVLCGEGGGYDPATDTWQPMAAAPRRTNHSAVWTGNQMLIWGARFSVGSSNDGQAYDPTTDTWTRLSQQNAPSPRGSHAAVWTGSEMLIWGGYGSEWPVDGGRYDPITNTWQPINATEAAPSPRENAAAVWTGTEMIIWGGSGQGTGFADDGAAYNPTTDTWRSIAQQGAPTARSWPTAVWTGSEIACLGRGVCHRSLRERRGLQAEYKHVAVDCPARRAFGSDLAHGGLDGHRNADLGGPRGRLLGAAIGSGRQAFHRARRHDVGWFATLLFCV